MKSIDVLYFSPKFDKPYSSMVCQTCAALISSLSQAARSLEKLVGRLKGLCLQLEPDVKVKREEVIMLNAGTESNTAPEPDKCDGTEAMTSVV